MSQQKHAKDFAALHRRDQPLILHNIWDVGSARAIAKGGAEAVATSSFAVAAAQGHPDGEVMPFEGTLSLAGRIAESVDLPVSIDFEGGYAVDPDQIYANVLRLIQTGAIGLNFEDQLVGGDGLHGIVVQQDRIKAVRRAGLDVGLSLFINARTDLFLKTSDPATHSGLVAKAVERGAAYRDAGADCFFVPGLSDPNLIKSICENVPLPVNIMVLDTTAPLDDMAAAGVARISHGPAVFMETMAGLAEGRCRLN
ncbi:MAG: isocitrate lyase/phosphoenolpyruvate mutase family protein [Pseudomonadota bacterium]